MRVLGLQSGTSMDGIDVAVLDLRTEGDGLVASGARYAEAAYDEPLRERLVAAVAGESCDAARLCALDTGVAAAFADAAAEHGPADLVASMGQTLYHWVDGGRARGTLQLGQPAWIAERTGTPVAADFRPRDVAAGGQGAPLAPVLDELLLRGRAVAAGGPVAAVNVGGIANVTVVGPTGPPLGYDTGPGNALLDAAWQRGDRPGGYDRDAAVGRTGTVHAETLRALLADPYYRRRPPKSTGKEHFDAAYLSDHASLPLPDLLATLTELTATHVADACREHRAGEVLLSGGGAANPLLRARIAELLAPTPVRTIDALGVPAGGKEAVLAAVLGWLTWHGVPANVPAVTGASGPRVLGCLTPGTGPLRLPEPRAAAPAWLRVEDTPPGQEDQSQHRGSSLGGGNR